MESLDFAELEIPALDPEPRRFRLLRLDIESALYVMSIFFCLLTTEEEYERAVNSFQLDESLMACIANLTGDLVFRSWTPLGFSPWQDVGPRDLIIMGAAVVLCFQARDSTRDVDTVASDGIRRVGLLVETS